MITYRLLTSSGVAMMFSAFIFLEARFDPESVSDHYLWAGKVDNPPNFAPPPPPPPPFLIFPELRLPFYNGCQWSFPLYYCFPCSPPPPCHPASSTEEMLLGFPLPSPPRDANRRRYVKTFSGCFVGLVFFFLGLGGCFGFWGVNDGRSLKRAFLAFQPEVCHPCPCAFCEFPSILKLVELWQRVEGLSRFPTSLVLCSLGSNSSTFAKFIVHGRPCYRRRLCFPSFACQVGSWRRWRLPLRVLSTPPTFLALSGSFIGRKSCRFFFASCEPRLRRSCPPRNEFFLPSLTKPAMSLGAVLCSKAGACPRKPSP